MSKLVWKKVKSIRTAGIQFDPSRDVWYRAIYEKSFPLEYKKFGKRTWGSSRLEASIQWRFSIHPRNTITEQEPAKYQLLIAGLSGINGHIYVDTVDEGKKIAQEICDYFIKKMQSIK